MDATTLDGLTDEELTGVIEEAQRIIARRAATARIPAQIEELAVAGSLAGDREMIYQAICYDPLTAAVCSLREIRDMVDEMFEANKDWLPQFKR